MSAPVASNSNETEEERKERVNKILQKSEEREKERKRFKIEGEFDFDECLEEVISMPHPSPQKDKRDSEVAERDIEEKIKSIKSKRWIRWMYQYKKW